MRLQVKNRPVLPWSRHAIRIPPESRTTRKGCVTQKGSQRPTSAEYSLPKNAHLEVWWLYLAAKDHDGALVCKGAGRPSGGTRTV